MDIDYFGVRFARAHRLRIIGASAVATAASFVPVQMRAPGARSATEVLPLGAIAYCIPLLVLLDSLESPALSIDASAGRSFALNRIVHLCSLYVAFVVPGLLFGARRFDTSPLVSLTAIFCFSLALLVLGGRWIALAGVMLAVVVQLVPAPIIPPSIATWSFADAWFWQPAILSAIAVACAAAFALRSWPTTRSLR